MSIGAVARFRPKPMTSAWPCRLWARSTPSIEASRRSSRSAAIRISGVNAMDRITTEPKMAFSRASITPPEAAAL